MEEVGVVCQRRMSDVIMSCQRAMTRYEGGHGREVPKGKRGKGHDIIRVVDLEAQRG